MSNLKKHVAVGAAVGGGVNLAWQVFKILDDPNPPKDFWDLLGRINFLEVAGFALGGAVCAALPDMLEPATNNPRHRAVFHSVTCAGVVTYGAFGKHTQNLSPEQKHALRVAALSYLSHLLLDSNTADGLPITGLTRIKFD